jgi:hypothetical protein
MQTKASELSNKETLDSLSHPIVDSIGPYDVMSCPTTHHHQVDIEEVPPHPMEPSLKTLDMYKKLTSEMDADEITDFFREPTIDEIQEEMRNESEHYGRDRQSKVRQESDRGQPDHQVKHDFTHLKPSIPQEELNYTDIPPFDKSRVQKITNSESFKNAATLRSHVGILCSDLRNSECGKRISFQNIGINLNIPNAATIKKQWAKYKEPPLENGRTPLKNDDADKFIDQIIVEKFTKQCPITIPELIDDLE